MSLHSTLLLPVSTTRVWALSSGSIDLIEITFTSPFDRDTVIAWSAIVSTLKPMK